MLQFIQESSLGPPFSNMGRRCCGAVDQSSDKGYWIRLRLFYFCISSTLKPPTSTVPSSQLWAVGNEKTGGKPQFWDISLEGCCPQKKSENDKTKLSGKLLAQKISYNEPNLFLYADNTEIMEYSHSVVAI